MKNDIRLDKKKLKKIMALMGEIKSGVPKVIVKAINETLSRKK